MKPLKGTACEVKDIVESGKKAMDAVEIKNSLADGADLSTVYRALKRLEKKRLVNVIYFPSGVKYYFSAEKDGHFLMCENCHEVIEFDTCGAGDIQEKVSRKYGYDVKGHTMIITGLCPDCRKVMEKQKGRI